MNYKEPDAEQLKLMQDFSDICSKGMEIILQCEPHITLQHASARMQESMSWFHSYVINGGKLNKETIN